MMEEKEKKLVPYELYAAKQQRKGDHLANAMLRKLKQRQISQNFSTLETRDFIKKQVNQKRIEQLKKEYNSGSKISQPTPCIKRTWVSPYTSEKVGGQSYYSSVLGNMNILKQRKKDYQGNLLANQKQQLKDIEKRLYMNSKIHYFGDYMYSDFDEKRGPSKQNNHTMLKNKPKVIQKLYREYLKLEQSDSRMLICNKGARITKFYNPLKNDQYYNKIMKTNDNQLMKLLIQILSSSNSFNFSSFIHFYDTFVWQQSPKSTQIDFVLKLLMKNAQKITYSKLTHTIDFFCSKISLPGNKQSLEGFNQVMKKLILGQKYIELEEEGRVINREMLRTRLEINEECISIFINVFYCE